jgi:outer membrane immunogenic protein
MTGFTGGGYAGCDYQFGAWVAGVEGDWSAMNKAGQNFPPYAVPTPIGMGITLAPATVFQTTENWLATARGRVGYAVDKYLFYVTGGAAWARIESALGLLGPVATPTFANLQTDTRSGWVIGGGAEYAPTLLKGHWAIRTEYLYVSIPSYTTFTPGSGPGGFTSPALLNLSTGRLTNFIARVGISRKLVID